MDEFYFKNKTYYDEFYKRINPDQIAEQVRRRDTFLSGALSPGWEGLYFGAFRERMSGATILEIGAGDGLNSLILAALGAEKVVALDITYHTRRIVTQVAAALRLSEKVETRMGDFATMDFEVASFDYVVGKEILHHLPHDVEKCYLRKAAQLLKPTGEMRFSEPAGLLPGEKLHEGPEKGLHPPRDNSTAHYQSLCDQYFAQVYIVPIQRVRRVRFQVIIARQPLLTGKSVS